MRIISKLEILNQQLDFTKGINDIPISGGNIVITNLTQGVYAISITNTISTITQYTIQSGTSPKITFNTYNSSNPNKYNPYYLSTGLIELSINIPTGNYNITVDKILNGSPLSIVANYTKTSSVCCGKTINGYCGELDAINNCIGDGNMSCVQSNNMYTFDSANEFIFDVSGNKYFNLSSTNPIDGNINVGLCSLSSIVQYPLIVTNNISSEENLIVYATTYGNDIYSPSGFSFNPSLVYPENNGIFYFFPTGNTVNSKYLLNYLSTV